MSRISAEPFAAPRQLFYPDPMATPPSPPPSSPPSGHAPASPTGSASSATPGGRPTPEPTPDFRDRGAGDAASDTRLFMQLLAFTGCRDPAGVVAHTRQHAQTPAVLYQSLNDPLGAALLTFSTEPAAFLESTRPLVVDGPLGDCTPLPAFTMFGRAYSLGYERDLQDTLVHRPARHALNPAMPWAVWYPLRRKGSFETLPRPQQMEILKEHGNIGMAYGGTGQLADIRLACHGLDAADNDFVIGLVGQQLAPLSKLVQRMRQTDQTSQYLEKLGPFYVGQAIYQSEHDLSVFKIEDA